MNQFFIQFSSGKGFWLHAAQPAVPLGSCAPSLSINLTHLWSSSPDFPWANASRSNRSYLKGSSVLAKLPLYSSEFPRYQDCPRNPGRKPPSLFVLQGGGIWDLLHCLRRRFRFPQLQLRFAELPTSAPAAVANLCLLIAAGGVRSSLLRRAARAQRLPAERSPPAAALQSKRRSELPLSLPFFPILSSFLRSSVDLRRLNIKISSLGWWIAFPLDFLAVYSSNIFSDGGGFPRTNQESDPRPCEAPIWSQHPPPSWNVTPSLTAVARASSFLDLGSTGQEPGADFFLRDGPGSLILPMFLVPVYFCHGDEL